MNLRYFPTKSRLAKPLKWEKSNPQVPDSEVHKFLVKLKKTVQGNTTEYSGAMVYKDGKLELIHMPEGYIEPTDNGYEYIYRITDHLGNTRVSFKKNSLTDKIDVLATNDYYPFGLEHGKAGTTVESSNLGENYKFNGVELENSTGLYEMDFRQYDPTLGRFTSVDQLAEERYSVSTYNFAQNNPVLRIDPLGLLDYNPVYNSLGKFLGTTIEGFMGQAIIYDENLDFENLTKEELLEKGGTLISNFIFDNSTIEDNIISHIVNYDLDDGLNVEGEVSIISKETDDFLFEATGTKENLEVTRAIRKNGKSESDKYYEPTVENLRNVINIHEVRGHLIDGIRKKEDHYKANLLQINHRQFQNTTERFKGKTLHSLYELNPRILEDKVLKSLYYKLGYPYWINFNKN